MNVYVTDIIKVTQLCSSQLFLCDALIYITVTNIHDIILALQLELNNTQDWLNFVKPKFYVSKTKAMVINAHRHNNVQHVNTYGIPIEIVSHIKYLGVVIANKLKFRKLCRFHSKKDLTESGYY